MHMQAMPAAEYKQMIDGAHLAARRHWSVGPDTFRRVLRASSVLPAEAKFLEFDCRQFSDPDEVRGGLRHLGFNARVMYKLAHHAEFKYFLDDVLDQVADLLKAEPVGAPVHIMFFCKKGRHRSVAVALLVGQALLMFGQAVSSEHLSSHTWPFDTCNNCNECRYPRGNAAYWREDARKTAVEMGKAWARKKNDGHWVRT